ncbi:hypothetical protein POF53_18640 [Mitsuaria sp. RG]|uniref:hypothetical protein n=1 Tax=Pseudomonas sp. AA27 TaxID=2908652 RepID=UPI001F402149|nr:hypothetical protein [Pseudomonas sp. AA27]MCF1490779.1 hypothetical protein [Pseudomonas sp. AA27]MDC0689620.1 hypothetical protein [Mitsuaria sp. RG]
MNPNLNELNMGIEYVSRHPDVPSIYIYASRFAVAENPEVGFCEYEILGSTPFGALEKFGNYRRVRLKTLTGPVHMGRISVQLVDEPGTNKVNEMGSCTIHMNLPPVNNVKG